MEQNCLDELTYSCFSPWSLLSEVRNFLILRNILLGPLLILLPLLRQSHLLSVTSVIMQEPATSGSKWSITSLRLKRVDANTAQHLHLGFSKTHQLSMSQTTELMDFPVLNLSPLFSTSANDPRLGFLLVLDSPVPVASASKISPSPSILSIFFQQPTILAAIISHQEYSKGLLNGFPAPIFSFFQFILHNVARKFILENKYLLVVSHSS